MLDEPASGLAKPEIEQLDDLLLSLNGDGMAILLIEHVLGPSAIGVAASDGAETGSGAGRGRS